MGCTAWWAVGACCRFLTSHIQGRRLPDSCPTDTKVPMAHGPKRKSSALASRKYKKPRFKSLEADKPDPSVSVSVTQPHTSSASQLPDQPDPPRVKINTINVYGLRDGRRIGQNASTHEVTFNPAEWIFSPHANPLSNEEQSWSGALADDSIVGRVDTLDTPNDTTTQSTPSSVSMKKKRLRPELRAAVCTQ